MLKFALVAALIASASAVPGPLAATNTFVLSDRINVGGQTIQYAAFVVDFNQPIYFRNQNGNLIAAKDAWNTTIPGMTDVPPSVINGFGASMLNCPLSNFNNRSSILDFNAMNNGPPLGLLTAPAVEEPIAAFINSFAQGIAVQELGRPERFAAVTLFGWPQSPSENGPRAFTNCSLQFTPPPPPGLPAEALQMIHNVTDAQGNPFVGNVTFGAPLRAPPCTFSGIGALLDTLGTILGKVDLAANRDSGNSLELTIASWQQRSAFVGCSSLLNSFFNQVNVTKTSITTQCNAQYGTLDWAADPCCNYQARFAQCCLPRVQNTTIPSIGNVTDAFQQCRHSTQMGGLLQAFTTWKQSIDSLPDLDTSSLYEKLTSFQQSCYNDMWNKRCSSNSDCYSGQCNSDSGTCMVPFGQEQKVLVPCFIDRMDPSMKVEFETLLGLPVSYSSDVAEKAALTNAFAQAFTIEDCVGPRSYQWRRQYRGNMRNDNGTYSPYIIPGNRTGCLSEMACNYQQWPALTQDQCLNSDDARRHPYFCAQVSGNSVSWAMTQWSQCYADIWNVAQNQKASVCSSLNGTIDQWNNCNLPTRATEDSCQYNPAAACTATDSTGCHQNACYAPADNSTACDALYSTAVSTLNQVWGHSFSSQNNVCLIQLQDVSQCSLMSLNFTVNTWFNKGMRETNATCTGYCNTPALRNSELVTSDQCAQQRTCTKQCGDKCRSNNPATPGVCIDATATQQNCTTGRFSWGSQKCYYNSTVDATACAAMNKTWFQCESLTSSSSCQSNQYNDFFSCFWDINSYCDSQAECNAHGTCSDVQYQNWNNQTAGVCEVAIVYDNNNNPTNCPQNSNDVSWWGNSCIYRNITEPAACTAFGGTYQRRALNSTQCDAHGSGCQESSFGMLTAKNASYCATCGGQTVNKFQWISGQWQAPEWVTLSWIPRQWTSINSWAPTINDADLSIAISDAASRIISRAVSVDYNQRYKYYSQILRFVACDCTPGSDSRACFGGAQMQSQAAQDRVVPGVSRQVGPVTIQSGTFSGNQSVSVTVYVVPAFQFLAPSGGNQHRLAKRTTSDYTSYAVVQYNGNTVGQLLGNAYTISSTATPSGAFPICLTIDSTIPTNAAWTTYDIGSLNNDQTTWAPLQVNVTVTGTQLCGNITTVGTFAPVLRNTVLTAGAPPSSTTAAAGARATQTSTAKTGAVTSAADGLVAHSWFPILMAFVAVLLI